MRASLLVIGLLGCADVPKEMGFDDDSLAPTVNGDTGAVIVTGPFYEMEFGLPGPDKFPMPDRLTVGGDEIRPDVLANANPPCAFEARVGLALFPGIDISSLPGRLGMEGRALVSRIEQRFAGPAAIRYEVSYSASYQAGNDTRIFEGTTTFTFFATGRITRFDSFTPIEDGVPTIPASVAPFGCNSSSAETFFLTSYWAFDPADAVQIAADGTDVVDGNPEACTYYEPSNTMIGVAWPQPIENEQFVRYRPGGNMTAGHVFDFLTDGFGNGEAELPAGRRTVSSSMIVEGFVTDRADCERVLGSLGGGMLRIDDAPFPADEFGVYHGLDNVPRESTITLTSSARLPPGVAVVLNLGTAKHAEVRKVGGSTPPAYVQQVDNQRVLFVLRDALLAGETVTIEPF